MDSGKARATQAGLRWQPIPLAKGERVSAIEILSVHVEEIDSTAVVFADGDLDCWTGPALVAACELLVSRGVDDLGIDCAQVDFIDCAGVRALVDVVDLMRSVGGTAVLVNVPARWRWLLDVVDVNLAVMTVDIIVLRHSVPVGDLERNSLSLN